MHAAPTGEERPRPMLPEDERRRLLMDWSGAPQAPGSGPLPGQLRTEAFAEQARRTPDAVALIAGPRRWTYHQLDARANQLARRLQRAGVGPDVPVGLCLERSPELVIGLLAILKAGGAFVALEPSHPPRHLDAQLDLTQPRLLLTCQPIRTRLSREHPHALLLDDLDSLVLGESESPPEVRLLPQNIAAVMFTSGSTGLPKAITRTHGAMAHRPSLSAPGSGTPPGRHVLKTTLDSTLLVREIFWPLLRGDELIIAEPGIHRDASALVRFLAGQRISHLTVIPSFLRRLLDEPNWKDCTALREVSCFGEPLSPDVERQFLESSAAELTSYYGTTEAPSLAARKCHRTIPGPQGNLGFRLGSWEVYILDPHQELLPIGVPGELCVGGPGLSDGYLRQPDLTATSFVPHPFSSVPGARLYRTGDRVRWRADGSLDFMGRLDEQLKIRGFRIEPGEVEAALRTHPAVLDAAVDAQARAGGEPRLVAFIVHRNPAQTVMARELRDHLGTRVPPQCIPSVFTPLADLPRRPNGKLDRRALPAASSMSQPATPTDSRPLTPLETVLADLWREMLGVERVGLHDSFNELGGDSLLALRMVFELRQRTGRSVSVSTLAENPTLEDFARTLLAGSDEGLKGANSGPCLFFIPATPGVNFLPPALLSPLAPVAAYFDGLQFPGVGGLEAPLDTVPGLAAALLRRVRQLRRPGPLALAGYSFGGNVAFEMACHLVAEGEPPPLVLLYDSCAPGSLRRRSLARAGFALLRHLRRLGPRAALDFLRHRSSSKFRVTRERLARELGVLPPHGSRADLPPLSASDAVRKQVFDASFRAIASFQPRPYPGPVVLFRSVDRDLSFGAFRELDALNGWAPLVTGPFAVEDTPGDHWHLFDEPGARRLGERTAAWLADCPPRPPG